MFDQAVEPKRPRSALREWTAALQDRSLVASICVTDSYVPESSCADSDPSDRSDALNDEKILSQGRMEKAREAEARSYQRARRLPALVKWPEPERASSAASGNPFLCPITSRKGTRTISSSRTPTIAFEWPEIKCMTAEAPSRDASTRSCAVGEPPRWVWPRIQTFGL